MSRAVDEFLKLPEHLRQIGPYVLERPLGKGGFAPVWLAREMTPGQLEPLRNVAVKLFSVDEESVGAADRVAAEARALCSVSHRNVVTFLSLQRSGDVLALAMEYVEGVSVQQQLDEAARNGARGLPIADVLILGATIASALQAVHDAKLVHRDVKPANVVFSEPGYRLIDFGIVAGNASLGSAPGAASGPPVGTTADSGWGYAGVPTGTMGYIDPQVLAGKPATPQSDLYSLGVMLFECVAGVLPSDAAGEGLSNAVRRGERAAPRLGDVVADAPPAFCTIVDSLLRAEPLSRPGGAREVSIALSAVGAWDWRSKPRRPWGRRVLKAASVLVLGSAFAGLIGRLYTTIGPPVDPSVPPLVENTMAPPPPVTLRIGLSSENPEPLVDYLRAVGAGPTRIEIETLGYESARARFLRDDFDVVMMDDPWVPTYATELVDLRTIRSFGELFAGRPPESIYIPSLLEPAKVDGVLKALPVTGNVLMLLIRKDVVEKHPKCGGAALLRDDDHPVDLDQLARTATCLARAGVNQPVGIRYDTSNDAVEIFWELLRAFGYQDELKPDGTIRIPLAKAERAMAWMKSLPNEREMLQQTPKKTVELLMDPRGPMGTAIAWPLWLIHPMHDNDRLRDNLVVKQISSAPVMGSWYLGVRRSSRHQAEALKIVHDLSAGKEAQAILSKMGNVSVLESTTRGDVGGDPFLHRRFLSLSKALRSSKPRPRTPKWLEIEDLVGKQLQRGKLESGELVEYY